MPPTPRPPGPEAADDAPQIHPSSVVDPGARLGAGTVVWHFCHVMAGAEIGPRSSLGQCCFVAGGARLGAGVRLQNHVSVFDGVILEDEVFCGPSAVFTNVRRPRAAWPRRGEVATTRVGRGATVGANATVLPGVTIGAYALVGAGATVTRDVPAHAQVTGTPARVTGWVSHAGRPLRFDATGEARCPETHARYRLRDDRLESLDPEPVPPRRAGRSTE